MIISDNSEYKISNHKFTVLHPNTLQFDYKTSNKVSSCYFLKPLYIGMKTITPDIIIDIIVVRDISDEFIKIKATRKIHSKAMNPICIGVSFFRPI